MLIVVRMSIVGQIKENKFEFSNTTRRCGEKSGDEGCTGEAVRLDFYNLARYSILSKVGSNAQKMKKLLGKLGLYESLDLELQMRPDHVFNCLKAASDSQPISITNLLSLNRYAVEYKWSYREVNEERLHVHVDIYPKHYIIFLQGLFGIIFLFSMFGLGLPFLAFLEGEFTWAFGGLSFYVLFLFLFPIKMLKKMQWRIWDLRLDIEKELVKKEKELKNGPDKEVLRPR